MTPSTSQSAMLGAFSVIVVLCDPHGRFEAAVAATVGHRVDQMKIVRAQPQHPTTDRLYIMDHHLAVEILTDTGRHRPQVLAITDREDGNVLKEAVSVGTIGLLSLSRLTETLTAALARIHRGQPYYDQQLLRATVHTHSVGDTKPAYPRLTAREREVLAAIVAGHTTRGMAQHLGISVATVRSHVHKVLAKLGVHSRIEAAALMLAEPSSAPPVGGDMSE